jgi:molybdate transport system permease protein
VRRADRVLATLAGVATVALVAFVVLPIVAICVRVPAATLVEQLRSRVVLDAVGVSLKTTAITLVLILAVGTPAAYVLSLKRSRGAAFIEALVTLPLVMPPAVAGVGLLAAFGRAGLLGGTLGALGVRITFTQIAVVMALSFVAMPFYVRQAMAAFGSVDPELLAASRTLGAGAAATFLRVGIPLARSGLAAGAALAWARALGEFGATIVFAGNLQGKTQTLPLAIYEQFSVGDLATALAIAALLVAISAGLLVGISLLLRRERRGEEERGWPTVPSSRLRSTIA